MTDKPYTTDDIELVAGWFRRWLGGSASNIRQRDREHATEILDALAATGRLRVEREVHEWFARALRDQETPARPLAWPDRPDVYWCAGLAGGCDAYHRDDFPSVEVIADDMPLRVCAATVKALP